jgi:hypothetical protein
MRNAGKQDRQSRGYSQQTTEHMHTKYKDFVIGLEWNLITGKNVITKVGI